MNTDNAADVTPCLVYIRDRIGNEYVKRGSARVVIGRAAAVVAGRELARAKIAAGALCTYDRVMVVTRKGREQVACFRPDGTAQIAE